MWELLLDIYRNEGVLCKFVRTVGYYARIIAMQAHCHSVEANQAGDRIYASCYSST